MHVGAIMRVSATALAPTDWGSDGLLVAGGAFEGAFAWFCMIWPHPLTLLQLAIPALVAATCVQINVLKVVASGGQDTRRNGND